MGYSKIIIETRCPLNLELNDDEWERDYIDHDRQIVRAVVFDDEHHFYFVRAFRDDDFGKAALIETSGGGVEPEEDFTDAIRRELMEELGATVDIVCELGMVSDYYNLIHRHNINHYFLCKAVSFGENHLTREEINDFHLSTLKMSYQEAVCEYQRCAETKIGRLIARRELPVLQHARKIIAALDNDFEIGNS